jgi:hypothetical protein
MKKAILILIISICISQLSAQGNLQFNQVKKVTVSETVPANKVWKIEGVIYNTSLSNFSDASTQQMLTYDNYIIIDGISDAIRSIRGIAAINSGAKAYVIWEQKFPIWLKAGSTLAISTGVQFISVIEFNIVP